MRRLPLRSPPRMRGKGLCKGFHLCDVGITPACAGKSEKQVPFLPPYQDHPRVCGEKSHQRGLGLLLLGSPPHVRGKGWQERSTTANRRITPACAGKSFRDNLVSRQLQDHPCVCGEKIFRLSGFTKDEGSPPHVRGKDDLVKLINLIFGITPAYAGKSWRGTAEFISK